MRRAPLLSLLLLVAVPARAQMIGWTPNSFSGDAVRAKITGGPWTLGTTGSYPAPNDGDNDFEPDYQPFVTVDQNGNLQGLFDYRPEELEEAVLAASSSDGIHWVFAGEALDYAGVGSDDGQGHPFAMAVGGSNFLYTLDRTAGAVDSAQLIVNVLTPSVTNLLAGLPATQVPVPPPGTSGSTRTVGLLNPDGIIGVVPGSSPVEILYVQKQLAVASGADLTTVRLATTLDGVTFLDLGSVDGLTDPCVAQPNTCISGDSVTYVASRGTLFSITDSWGTFQAYGLLFSAGLWGEDSDAFHYVGYAESPDLQSWTVFNGFGDADDLPLISIDGEDLTPTGLENGTPLKWYQSRAYAPSAVADSTGCVSFNLIFSGYSGSAKKTSDYRQVGQVSLDLTASGMCVVVAGLAFGSDTGGTSGSSGTLGSIGTTVSSTTSGSSTGGSSTTAGATTAGASVTAVSSGSGSSGISTSSSASVAGGASQSSTSGSAQSSGTATGGTTGRDTTGGTSGVPLTSSTTSAGVYPYQGAENGCSTGFGGSSLLVALAGLGLSRRRRS